MHSSQRFSTLLFYFKSLEWSVKLSDHSCSLNLRLCIVLGMKHFLEIFCMSYITGLMPPSSSQEYDMHLANAIHGLTSLKKELTAGIINHSSSPDN